MFARIIEEDYIMGLAAFIQLHEKDIIEEWETFAQTCKPAADDMDPPALRNHIRKLLQFIIDDLRTPQTEEERSKKAKGMGPKAEDDSVAGTHGEIRLTDGFDLVQVHSEFRALRASVLKLWSNEWTKSNKDWVTPAEIIPDIMRFNEAIDQLVSESLCSYINKSDDPRPSPSTYAAQTHSKSKSHH